MSQKASGIGTQPVGTAPVGRTRLNKVPEPTVHFWIVKILCTTVGESCADYINSGLHFGLTNTTLMRRIDRLEYQLGAKLFVRHQSGLALSDEGKGILDDVKNMEQLSFNVFRRASRSAELPMGVVRLAATEGPGTYWVLQLVIGA